MPTSHNHTIQPQAGSFIDLDVNQCTSLKAAGPAPRPRPDHAAPGVHRTPVVTATGMLSDFLEHTK